MKYLFDEYFVEGAYQGFIEAQCSIDKNDDYIYFYFNNHGVSADEVLKLKTFITSPTVAILMNIRVNKEARGQGSGKKMINLFLSKIDEDCLLICEGEKDFALQEWYESQGFQSVQFSQGRALMIKHKA